MSVEAMLKPGTRVVFGKYHFTEDDIVAFATEFDPQPFHIDPEAARGSMFGALCASGWHTVSVWMKLYVAYIDQELASAAASGEDAVEYGPSPGWRNLRWLKPVYADSTITFGRTMRGVRRYASRQGWSIVENTGQAWNDKDDLVLSFDSTVLVRLPEGVRIPE